MTLHLTIALVAQMHNPAHPGEALREFLPKDLPIGEVASRPGVSPPEAIFKGDVPL
jgi:plasmid maintenance system antidote protein VapI